MKQEALYLLSETTNREGQKNFPWEGNSMKALSQVAIYLASDELKSFIKISFNNHT